MEIWTAQKVLDIIRRTFPAQWVSDRFEAGGGEILLAIAHVMERVSTAVKRAFDGLTPGLADFGSKASGTVTLKLLAEPPADWGGMKLEIGTRLWTIHGESFVLTETASWALDDLADKSVSVESERASWQANLLAGTLLTLQDASPAVERQTLLPVLGVVEPPGLTGGAAPCLETLASQRGVKPSSGESASVLRRRLVSLGRDLLTPNAIRRLASSMAVSGFEIVEAWDVVGFCDVDMFTDGSWDLAAPNGKHSRAFGDFPTNWFVLRVDVPKIPAENARRLFVDYGFCHSSNRSKIPPSFSGSFLAARCQGLTSQGDVYNAGDYAARAEIAALCQAVEQIRAAGIFFFIEEV